MRMSYLKTSLIVLMLVVFLMPMAVRMSRVQADKDAYDAQHVIQPLISLYRQSALHSAQ